MPSCPLPGLPASLWQSGGQAEKDAEMTLIGIHRRSRTLIDTLFPACHIGKNVARRLTGVAAASIRASHWPVLRWAGLRNCRTISAGKSAARIFFASFVHKA